MKMGRKVSGLPEQLSKVYFVKSFGKIQQAAVHIRASPQIMEDGFLNSPGALHCGASLLETKPKKVI
jgi:hypothetical protein